MTSGLPPSRVVAASDDATASRHGFFLRLATGPGYLSVTYTGYGFAGSGQAASNPTFASLVPVGELSIGGAPIRGLVVGGTLVGTHATLKDADGSGSTVEASYVLVAPFVQYYFLGEHGPHLGAAPGMVLRMGGSNFGLSATVGYDFAVSERWKLGVLGRLAYSPTYGAEGTAVFPSLAFAATHY